MNPRDKLIENIIDLVHARTGHAYDDALGDLLEATLKTHYAIGRWVSVEERCPDRRGFYRVKWDDEYAHPDFRHSWFDPAPFDKVNYWFSVRSSCRITHWLELDMPNGKGKA